MPCVERTSLRRWNFPRLDALNAAAEHERTMKPALTDLAPLRLASLTIAVCLSWASTGLGADSFEGFLEKHCVRCHGPEKVKGDVRIDKFSRDFKGGADAHHWGEVL